MVGRAGRAPDGRVVAEFRLWDVLLGPPAGLPALRRRASASGAGSAHLVADQVYQRLTGEKGYFDTQIVFVDETGPKDRRNKRLAIMDQDGANVRLLSQGRELVLTPRFSPTAQEITFMQYTGDQPRVFLMNLETGKRELVGDFPGMTFAPRFSPDGQRVIMSIGEGGATAIVEMDLRSRQTRHLTQASAIDTGPCYSPDGRRIVFESDRDGSQQLYVMGADGSGQRRISFGEGRYSTPVWSPRGDLIAFTKQMRRQLPDRRHALGRLRRAHPHRGLPQRGPDLGSQRPRAHVLPREPRGAAAGRSSSPSTSPATTSARCRRRPSAPIPAWSPLRN